MSIKTSQFIGGILLVAGCCVGAGMLGLPIVTGPIGFIPSSIMFVISWLLMLTSGLLLLEVNLYLGHESGIISMATHTLGKAGRVFSWVVFCFLFYCLMVAYIAGSGTLIASACHDYLGLNVRPWMGSTFSILLFGSLLMMQTKAIDKTNRFLVAGKVVTYLLLVIIGMPSVKTAFLQYRQYGGLLSTMPILLVSFGYHNMIPTITDYFQGNRKALTTTLFVGTFIPLVIYLVWEALVLGIVPVEGPAGIQQALQQGETASQVLQQTLQNSSFVTIGQYFGFFALATSYLTVAMSFVFFFGDAFKVSSKSKLTSRLGLIALVLLPPFALSVIYPKAFIAALNFAGGIGVVLICGLLPCAMVWVKRYRLGAKQKILVRGGRPLIGLVSLIFIFVLVVQLVEAFGGK